MRFGFGGHAEGSEPIDPKTKPKDLQGRSAGAHAAK
jgi:6-phosphogluconate dehydrogenase